MCLRMPPQDGSRELEKTDAYRAEFRARHIPAWYRGQLHVALTAACVLGSVLFCSSQLRGVRVLELLTVPIMLVLGSFFVWGLHRYVLHRPMPGLRRIYVIHTLQHHRFYTYERNEPEGPRDYYITLFPWAFGPSLVVAGYVLGRLVGSAVSANVGLLFTIMTLVYYGLYELVHLASHLPEHSRVLRLPGLRRLREHHRLHHDPRLMSRHNFNVVLPLADVLFGTLVRQRPQHESPGRAPRSDSELLADRL